MLDQFVTILGRQWHSYTLLLLLTAFCSAGWLLWQTPRDRRGQAFDVLLGAVIAGVICGRGLHVLLWRDYFAFHPDQITQLTAGGIAWHGVLVGGLAGAGFAAHIRGIALVPLLEIAAPLLPLVALAGWWGCETAGCAYGAPVARMTEYPAVFVTEAPDIFGIVEPRFATQRLGIVLSLLVFGVQVILVGQGWLRGRRFGLALLLLGAGMVGIGFLRADYMPVLAGLRVDQWLDSVVVLLGLVLLFTFNARASDNR